MDSKRTPSNPPIRYLNQDSIGVIAKFLSKQELNNLKECNKFFSKLMNPKVYEKLLLELKDELKILNTHLLPPEYKLIYGNLSFDAIKKQIKILEKTTSDNLQHLLHMRAPRTIFATTASNSAKGVAMSLGILLFMTLIICYFGTRTLETEKTAEFLLTFIKNCIIPFPAGGALVGAMYGGANEGRRQYQNQCVLKNRIQFFKNLYRTYEKLEKTCAMLKSKKPAIIIEEIIEDKNKKQDAKPVN